MSKLNKQEKNTRDQPKISSYLIKKDAYQLKTDLKNNKLISV
jgi:hypothetical protein